MYYFYGQNVPLKIIKVDIEYYVINSILLFIHTLCISKLYHKCKINKNTDFLNILSRVPYSCYVLFR